MQLRLAPCDAERHLLWSAAPRHPKQALPLLSPTTSASALALLQCRDRLAELWRRISEERQVAMHRPTPSAFVTFKTRAAQVRPEVRGAGRPGVVVVVGS